VTREDLPLGVYYEDLHALIDDGGFRRRLGVVRVVGELLDDRGERFQQIDNEYAATGELRRGRVVHADGTVTDARPERAKKRGK